MTTSGQSAGSDISMEFDRNSFIDALQEHGNIAEAAQAQLDLPEMIDANMASEWLSNVGLDPQEILGQLPIAEGQEVLSNVSESNPEELISNVSEGGIGEMIGGLFSKLTGR